MGLRPCVTVSVSVRPGCLLVGDVCVPRRIGGYFVITIVLFVFSFLCSEAPHP